MVHFGLPNRPTPFTLHTFRQSSGQDHAGNGTPGHVLQKLMGHASIMTIR